jgi:hypothetical protein
MKTAVTEIAIWFLACACACLLTYIGYDNQVTVTHTPHTNWYAIIALVVCIFLLKKAIDRENK